MIKTRDFHSSSIYRLGWQDGSGISQAQEVDYVGRYPVLDPEVYRRQVSWWAKSIADALLEELDENEDEEEEMEKRKQLINECVKKGMMLFAARKAGNT